MKKKLFEIFDGSYSLMSSENGMVNGFGSRYENCRFEILARGCKLPASNDRFSENNHNNTVARDVDSDLIVFTQERFIRPLTSTCPHCGESIKRTDER